MLSLPRRLLPWVASTSKLTLFATQKVKVKSVSRSVVSDSVTPQTIACQVSLSMVFSGKSSGVSSHSLLKEIFLTQGSNPGLLQCRQILYHLSHQGSP